MKIFNVYILMIALISIHTMFGAGYKTLALITATSKRCFATTAVSPELKHIDEAIANAKETVSRIDCGLKILAATDPEKNPQDTFDILDRIAYETTSNWFSTCNYLAHNALKIQLKEPILKYNVQHSLFSKKQAHLNGVLVDYKDLIPLARKLLKERKAQELKVITTMQGYLEVLSKSNEKPNRVVED